MLNNVIIKKMQTHEMTRNIFNIRLSRTFISVFEISLKNIYIPYMWNIKNLHEFVKRESGTKNVLTVR